ncbi:hypothetical protein [Pedobacter sp. Leaf194]|uniref:hypothetical protein n=1 Tax=Pedobacter sp. Leaf194 TaxID=1736297 RepID=UPI000703A07D|nr:hypothetical protein [Pedobacter sp. Leaf194]KQS36181.1 hypothetical protein ASG14_12170 [Pedobacter sp. Leaf194]
MTSTGFIYVTDTDSRIPFKYKVAYSTDENGNYLSKYKVLIYGDYKFDVIAKHIKSENKVIVEVHQAGGGILSLVSKQETTYSTPSTSGFGSKGVGQILGGNRVPNQIAVKFLAKSFAYVKVIDVLGYHGNDGAEYYAFN